MQLRRANRSSFIRCWTPSGGSRFARSNVSAVNAAGPRTKSKAASVAASFILWCIEQPGRLHAGGLSDQRVITPLMIRANIFAQSMACSRTIYSGRSRREGRSSK